jgi:hypothetical protein
MDLPAGNRVVLQLFPEAAHGEERVVDAKAEPEHGGDAQHVDGHVVDAGQEVKRRQDRQDAHTPDQDRDPGCHKRPEGDQQYDECQRKGILLGPPDVLAARVRYVQIDGGRSRYVGRQLV